VSVAHRADADPFRDDDSDTDESEIEFVGAQNGQRIVKSKAVRPQAPEAIPLRFTTRVGPEVAEPWRSVLEQQSLLSRMMERECGWKGCDAVLASEDLLRRHVEVRRHTAQAQFQAAVSTRQCIADGQSQTLWRCHWYGCNEPCFTSEEGLAQHVTARHVAKVLTCPYEDCDLVSPTISHLARVSSAHD
jgi:hypothetical protein